MIDYIKQMMEIAGVQKGVPIYDRGVCIAIAKDRFPDFTAEKQLEIIKLIADNENGVCGIGIFKIADDYYCTPENYWQIGKRATKNQDFTQALAQLTMELMEMDKLDKKKVKEILQ